MENRPQSQKDLGKLEKEAKSKTIRYGRTEHKILYLELLKSNTQLQHLEEGALLHVHIQLQIISNQFEPPYKLILLKERKKRKKEMLCINKGLNAQVQVWRSVLYWSDGINI